MEVLVAMEDKVDNKIINNNNNNNNNNNHLMLFKEEV